MLRRMVLRDVVIVAELELEFGAGLTVLTGETGAGKSILIDALQLALGGRGEALLVREGALKAEVSAEFDCPASLLPWLQEAGFAADDSEQPSAAPSLLLRRTVDAQGKSRAWVNGSAATVAQLREAAEHLVDIHGQHAWQSLTRPAAVRAWLDEHAGVHAPALDQAWQHWRQAERTLADAQNQQEGLTREHERLSWQVNELEKLAPAADEWESLNAEHQRLAHAQRLLEGAQTALEHLADDEGSATRRSAQASQALAAVAHIDPALAEVNRVLLSAQAQLDDAAHTLRNYLARSEPDPQRLQALDERLAAWMSQARRYRRQAHELPALLATWRAELAQLDAATDLAGLQAAAAQAQAQFLTLAKQASSKRQRATKPLATAVSSAMQSLGMAGGRFEIALEPQAQPAAYGLESVELRVAGHAGSAARPLAKVASGGELSRLALAIAASSLGAKPSGKSAAGHPAAPQAPASPTLIFDEIDAGVGGTVADTVGRLMQKLGTSAQVLAVTHLAQVAACAHHHLVVSKALKGKQTLSAVQPVQGEARVAEIARMLGGERASGTAHAQAMLSGAAKAA